MRLPAEMTLSEITLDDNCKMARKKSYHTRFFIYYLRAYFLWLYILFFINDMKTGKNFLNELKKKDENKVEFLFIKRAIY